MNVERIVAELEHERDRLNQAIALLKERLPSAARKTVAGKGKGSEARGRGGLTAAGRKRLSQLMKKRWAERRKAKSS